MMENENTNCEYSEQNSREDVGVLKLEQEAKIEKDTALRLLKQIRDNLHNYKSLNEKLAKSVEKHGAIYSEIAKRKAKQKMNLPNLPKEK